MTQAARACGLQGAYDEGYALLDSLASEAPEVAACFALEPAGEHDPYIDQEIALLKAFLTYLYDHAYST